MSRIRDLRHDALVLAVELFSHRSQDAYDDEGRAVVQAAGEFTRWLTAPAVTLAVGEPVVAEEASPAVYLPLNRNGATMAVTLLDTQQATYPAPSEDDSKGFPVSGDTITITEDSAGAVVALTVNPDGSATFAAVAPGSAQASWTDGTLSFVDTITVTTGAVASLVVGEPVITDEPAAVPPVTPPAP